MKRILVIGPNCSGKTTFSRKLRDKLSLPLVHLDSLYWVGDWQVRQSEEFNRLLDGELNKECWIMDGNMKKSLAKRLTYCDTVFWFDFPTWRCGINAARRLFTNLGKSRPDMGGNCVERLDKRSLSFIWTVLQFNRRNRGDFRKLLDEAEKRGVQVIVFRNYQQVRNYLKQRENIINQE